MLQDDLGKFYPGILLAYQIYIGSASTVREKQKIGAEVDYR